jgi:ATP-binding cassette subfamily B (MDR/TAP) protein 1
MALPELKHFTEASVAATRILDRINHVPQINADDPKGLNFRPNSGTARI